MKKSLALIVSLTVILAFASLAFAATTEELFKQADDAYAKKDAAAIKANMKALEPLTVSNEGAAWRYARASYEIGVNVTDEKSQDAIYKAGYKAVEPYYKKGSKDVNTIYWFAITAGKYANFHKFDAFKSGLAEEIKKASSKVIAADPGYENGNAYVVLGAVYYKLYVTPLVKGGDLDKSIENLKKALTYRPDSIFANLTLGQCYYEKKMYKEAKPYLETSLKGTPANNDDRKYLKEAKEYLEKVNNKLK
jgi:tetratricopeptide (TPR) repeat protein